MSYQVIARKYRPQKFNDVVGQEHVTQTLAHAIAQHRIAHAYLFCGPRGTGKTTIARIFAKCLNCTDGPNINYLDSDPKCQEIAEGRSLDVFEIDGASNNGVEQVRELRDTCKYAPASSKFKIYIIDEVHMLSTAAFNALLKTLEEPPEHVKFLFATTDPEKVLPTILSRCQRFDLRRIPTALISKHLSEIAAKEEVTIDPAALFAIARGAEGGMRDAESTLDQLISFCGNNITEPDVLSMFGLVAQSQLLEMSRAILAGEVDSALRQLNDLSKNGKDLSRLLSDLLNHFRNLLIFQVSRGDLTMLEVSEAEASVLSEQTKLSTADGLSRIMEVLADAETRLRDAVSKKILIEVALLNAIEARGAMSIDSLLKQLNALREGQPTGIPAAPAPARAPRPVALAAPIPAPPTPAPAPAVHYSAAPAAPAPTLIASEPSPVPPQTVALSGGNDLYTLWQHLLELVAKASPFTKTYLLEAHPVSFNKGVMIIGFPPETADHLALVDNPKNQALLQTKLAELGHANAMIKFIKSAAAPAEFGAHQASAPEVAAAPAAPAVPHPAPAVAKTAPVTAAKTAPSAAPKQAAPTAAAAPVAAPVEKTTSVPFNQDDFKNDPLIQKALEIFKGEIVQVRA